MDKLCTSSSLMLSPRFSFCRIVFLPTGSMFLLCQRELKLFLCIWVRMFAEIGNTLPRCTVLANIKVFKSIAFSYNYNFLEVNLFIWFSIFCRICCQFRKHACFRLLQMVILSTLIVSYCSFNISLVLL